MLYPVRNHACLKYSLPIAVYKLYPQYTSSTIPFVAILLIGGLMISSSQDGRIIPFLLTIIFVIFLLFNVGTLEGYSDSESI